MCISRIGGHSYAACPFFLSNPPFGPLVLQIPGLPEVTSQITPTTRPGLLGICLSGAGPTILALATQGFEAIAEDARIIFKQQGIEIDWKLLEVTGGSTVIEEAS